MDILENIKTAEDNADRIRSAAKKEAQEILLNAEKRAREESEKIIQKAKADCETISLDAVKCADEASAKAKEARGRSVSSLKSAAEAKKAEAVKKVIESI